ncbi:MAG TPA: LysR substrate-binding domain-containing protein [Holophagaceae bacterium]|nr:LysR substrate-binding domain-containing protein [Holophagaceae bacterium]
MPTMTLDLDTLRTLVVAQELGGFAPAAERLGRTPSAISLQMKRLQEDVGVELFRKRGRGLALTEAGERTLACARRMLALNDELLDALRGTALAGQVRLGCAQDFADTVLPRALAQFTRTYPHVQLELRIEGNAALAEAVAKGDLDLALTVGQADRPGAEVLGEVPLVWIAGEGFEPREGEALPLLLLGPQCIFRREAVARLEEAGLPWRVATQSPSLAGLWASAQGNLGLTARTPWGLPAHLHWGATLHGLPALGVLPVALHGRESAPHRGVAHLRSILRDAALQALLALRAG